jgi:hypothetical protein
MKADGYAECRVVGRVQSSRAWRDSSDGGSVALWSVATMLPETMWCLGQGQLAELMARIPEGARIEAYGIPAASIPIRRPDDEWISEVGIMCLGFRQLDLPPVLAVADRLGGLIACAAYRMGPTVYARAQAIARRVYRWAEFRRLTCRTLAPF